MKTYLLLRSNKQSGPYSLEDLLALGLKPQDLIWVDGHSASWRYPTEFDEFRALVAPPVGEAVVANEFTDAQNRILEAYPAEPAQPVHRDIPPVYQQPLRPLDFHGGISVDMAREADPPFELGVLPAFQAFGSLMEDEDMPTIALYQPLKTEAVVAVPVAAAYADGGALDAAPAPIQKADKARIQVSLPAARADKTLVVIQRRDESGRVVVPVRSKPRRPVIEFLPDDQQPSAPVLPLAADPLPVPPAEAPSHTGPESPISVAAEPQSEARQEIAIDAPTPAASVQEVAIELPPSAETTPEVATEQPSPVQVVDEVAVVAQPLTEQIQTGSPVVPAVAESSTPVESIAIQPVTPTGTLQVNIGLIQKVAVAAAIISLLVVAGLIANALFNPRAYDYGTTRPPQKSATAPPSSQPASSAAYNAPADTVLQQSTVAK